MLKYGLLSLIIAISAACGVYGLKNRVQMLEADLAKVERMIKKERMAMKRLKAEWATLTHPERLARLAEKHLTLKPAEPRQIASISDIPLRIDGDEATPSLVSALQPSAMPGHSTLSLQR